MARLGTDTSSWWWQEDNSITHQPAHQGVFEGARNPNGTGSGERQFQSQLELQAMIVRTLSDLDPGATKQARTTGFIH